MKTLLIVSLCFICLASRGQQNFANVNTGIIAPSLPTEIRNASGAFFAPTPVMCQSAGWRTITNVASPAAGMAVDSYTIVDTPPNCYLTVATSHSIRAAQDAVWTNSPNWLAVSNNAHAYSNLTWCYSPAHYTASLTNFVNTPQFIVAYYSSWVKTNASATVSNSVDFLNASWLLQSIIDFAGSSTNFPWRLCP